MEAWTPFIPHYFCGMDYWYVDSCVMGSFLCVDVLWPYMRENHHWVHASAVIGDGMAISPGYWVLSTLLWHFVDVIIGWLSDKHQEGDGMQIVYSVCMCKLPYTCDKQGACAGWEQCHMGIHTYLGIQASPWWKGSLYAWDSDLPGLNRRPKDVS